MANSDAVKWTVRERLEGGPMWLRSLWPVRSTVNAMIETGELELCRPEGGRARNMVRLAAPKSPRLSMTDHFAERLSRHGDVAKAAVELGQSRAWGARQFAAICSGLGAQAK